jgi:hypothetical protein
MEAKFKNTDDMYTFESALALLSNKVRFTFELDHKSTKRSATLKFRNIRLKESKLYCGNHPAMCEANGTQPRKAKFLEGADWVAFNDMLNDVADTLDFPIDIKSAVCVIRKGTSRRYSYGMNSDNYGNNEWEKDGCLDDYTDNTGQAPMESEFPDGTPGDSNYWLLQQELTD